VPVVITADLAMAVDALLARKEGHRPSNAGGGNPAGSSSALDRAAIRMSALTGSTPESCLRLLSKIRRRERPTTNANHADAALLALDDLSTLTDLPILFTERDEAFDAAAIHIEYAGGDPSDAETLAQSLRNFSLGFVSALETDEQRASRERDRRTATKRNERATELVTA
jgi:hypothetical protein